MEIHVNLNDYHYHLTHQEIFVKFRKKLYKNESHFNDFQFNHYTLLKLTYRQYPITFLLHSLAILSHPFLGVYMSFSITTQEGVCQSSLNMTKFSNWVAGASISVVVWRWWVGSLAFVVFFAVSSFGALWFRTWIIFFTTLNANEILCKTRTSFLQNKCFLVKKSNK